MNVSSKLSREFLKKGILPFIILVLVISAYLVYSFKFEYLLDTVIGKIFTRTSVAIIILSLSFFLQRLTGAFFSWYATNIARKTATTLDDEFLPLFRKATKTIIWIIALIIVLSYLGVNVNALIATLGVSSLAIALAAQDTISNIIAGFLIMIDRPFNIGDTIKLPSGEKVKVLDIGIRRSKFQGEENSIIIVPNIDLSRSKIVNFSYADKVNT